MNLNDVNLVVISGTSGSGKGTFIDKYCYLNKNVKIAISATTRPPRKDEAHGQEYYFLSDKEFDLHIENKNFIEYCQVHHYRYGTLKTELFESIEQKKNLVLEIDTLGASKIKKLLPNSLFIFIAAPDLNSLEKRLISRKTETKDQINKRLKTAETELTKIELYDYVIINDIIDNAYLALEKIINKRFALRG